jgi:hypothetical protein
MRPDETRVKQLGDRIMSCWVVPSIAAELWGVSVEQVLSGMKAGHIPSKQELGRMFVDVAPNSPKLETPKALRPTPPPTYTIVTPEEAAALVGEEEAETIDLGDWREAREDAGKRRRPPIAA